MDDLEVVMLEGFEGKNGIDAALRSLYGGRSEVERDLESKQRTYAILGRLAFAVSPAASLVAYRMMYTEYMQGVKDLRNEALHNIITHLVQNAGGPFVADAHKIGHAVRDALGLWDVLVPEDVKSYGGCTSIWWAQLCA
ncbi:hypothetical protein PENSPDRAFT_694804 [Peniophora sp. CONT]|nr:hypothetical protein PENSPDRAFT_694804 [Peniophora sp. CONT]